ncbi:hypothetical protein AURDEDRAFT_167821 [Auricularia subglabra TFB-10046 SS5]|nr:hypothetical protein AURDEDRAFT_167821 [Auricularia subglabra TFB-10046 SS5]
MLFAMDAEARDVIIEARQFIRFFKTIPAPIIPAPDVYPPPEMSLYDCIPHVYLSALAFTPASSTYRQRLLGKFPGIPKVSPVCDSWPPQCYRFDDISLGPYTCMVFISDSVVAMVRSGFHLGLYGYPSLRRLCRGRDMQERISCIAYSARNGLIASADLTGSLYFWDSLTLSERGVYNCVDRDSPVRYDLP